MNAQYSAWFVVAFMSLGCSASESADTFPPHHADSSDASSPTSDPPSKIENPGSDAGSAESKDNENEKPIGTPVVVPKTAPPACPGLLGTSPKPVDKPGYSSLVPLQPTLFEFSLGTGYPIFDSKQVATGTTTYGQDPTISSATSSAIGGEHQAYTDVSGYALADVIAPNDAAIFPYGNAYNTTYNDEIQPEVWGRYASTTPKNSLTFYAALRVDRGQARLNLPRRGAGWDSVAKEYVAGAKYTRYYAFAFHIVFDSTCKRDTYLSLAGKRSLSALLPKSGTNVKALSDFLIKANAQFAVRAIALGPRAEVQRILDATNCATDQLGACNELVEALTSVLKEVGKPALPTTFSAKPQGMNGWFVDSVIRDTKEYLKP
jgi:hypothetical protein